MQFTKPYKEAIVAGKVTTSFRRWKKPQVKVGGEYNIPPYGAIRVTNMTMLALQDASRKAIRDSGSTSIDELSKLLRCTPADTVYQVKFTYLGKDAVNQPDRSVELTAEEIENLTRKVDRFDRETPWAWQTLRLIANRPGTRAGDLAPEVNQELTVFKRNVRKLKALGLTESLEVGYQLSDRGRLLLSRQGEAR